MRTLTLIVTAIVVAFNAAVAAASIPSWEMPLDGEGISELDLPEEPDCKYSFKQDDICYWIDPLQKGVVMVVHGGRFYAREYCYGSYGPGPMGESIVYKDIEEVIIPETVTYEGQEYTVKTIFRSAFSGCPKLRRVVIPKTVDYLGGFAFFNCPMLSEVTLSPNINTLREGAFGICPSLKRIDLSHVNDLGCMWEYFGMIEYPMGRDQGPKALTEITVPYEPEWKIDAEFFQELRVVRCTNSWPSSVDIFFEPEVYVFGTLYLPLGAARVYRMMSSWNRFRNIVEEGSGVEAEGIADEEPFTITDNCIRGGNQGPVQVYKPDGSLACSIGAGEEAVLPNGIYIVRDASGASRKVFLR